MALERYNSLESASAYNLVLTVTNQRECQQQEFLFLIKKKFHLVEERILKENECPMAILQESEKSHPTSVAKLYLRKIDDTTPVGPSGSSGTAVRIYFVSDDYLLSLSPLAC